MASSLAIFLLLMLLSCSNFFYLLAFRVWLFCLVPSSATFYVAFPKLCCWRPYFKCRIFVFSVLFVLICERIQLACLGFSSLIAVEVSVVCFPLFFRVALFLGFQSFHSVLAGINHRFCFLLPYEFAYTTSISVCFGQLVSFLWLRNLLLFISFRWIFSILKHSARYLFRCRTSTF